MDSSARELCPDTIYEILSRSSWQTVARCRILSHEFNRLSYESSFMDLHSQRAKIVSGYFMQSLISCKYSSAFLCPDKSDSYPKQLPLRFLPNPVKILASTNQGILLCCSDHNHRIPTYYICKPTTKQWRSIPRPKTRYHTLATGMVMMKSNPLHYKIVRFSDPRYSNSSDFRHYHVVRCELFDSNTWKWKQLEVVKLPIREFFYFSPNVSALASLHWLTSRNNIFAFDVKNESYSLFSPPQPVIEAENKKIKLVEYEGKLALICTGKEDNLIDLWVMEKYDQKEWSKRFTINIESLRRKERYTWPISFYNADIALMKEWDRRVSFFNHRNGRTESVLLEKSFNGGCFPFRSDFELCDQLVPKRPKDVQTKKQQLKTSNINHIHEPVLMQAEDIRMRHNCFVMSPDSSFLVLLLAFIFFCFMLNL